jgi:hypothetical protein
MNKIQLLKNFPVELEDFRDFYGLLPEHRVSFLSDGNIVVERAYDFTFFNNLGNHIRIDKVTEKMIEESVEIFN